MKEEASYENLLSRGGEFPMSEKYTGRKIFGILKAAAVLLVLMASVTAVSSLLPPVTGADPSEDSEATVEGFSLFRYGDELTWKLSGERASENDEKLIVRDFKLVVRNSGNRTDEPLYEFSGEEIRVKPPEGSETGEIGVIPGEVDMEIENLAGSASGARYDFWTGKISGSNLNINGNVEGNDISMDGNKFEYYYTEERLEITGGFRLTIESSGAEVTEISGEGLTWARGEDITAENEVRVRTDAGWKISADEISWNPEEEILACSGSVLAVKDDRRVRGESLTYDRRGEQLTVKSGKMVIKGE